VPLRDKNSCKSLKADSKPKKGSWPPKKAQLRRHVMRRLLPVRLLSICQWASTPSRKRRATTTPPRLASYRLMPHATRPQLPQAKLLQLLFLQQPMSSMLKARSKMLSQKQLGSRADVSAAFTRSKPQLRLQLKLPLRHMLMTGSKLKRFSVLSTRLPHALCHHARQ